MMSEIAASAIISEGIKKVTEVIQKEKKNPQIVIVKSKPTKFLKARMKRISTVSTKSENAQGIIENPVDEDAVIKNISLIPNGTFKSSGQLLLKVNEVEIFEHDVAGDFTDVSILDIALPSEGKIISRGKSIEIFAWGSGSITVYVQFDRKEVD